jgi:hypothetical protein
MFQPDSALEERRTLRRAVGFKTHYREYGAMVEPSRIHADPVSGHDATCQSS